MTAAGRALGRCLAVLFCGVVPACLVGYLVARAGHYPTDFTTFWRSGHAVLHGRSPYPSVGSLPAHTYPTFAPFVYPPVTAVLFAPLSLLPFGVAVVVFLFVELAAVAVALRLLDVTDWRCYGVGYGSAPLFAASALGTITPLLFVGVAAAWRYRDGVLRAGLLVAFVVTAKLFLWPVWLWLVRTRRFRAAAVAAVASVAGLLASWATIGFAGMHDYPRLLGRVVALQGSGSYSVYALGRSLGLGAVGANTAVYLAGGAVLTLALIFTRGSRSLLAVALGVSLLLTPILWPHYLLLLFVPVALAQRRLSLAWLVPFAAWFDCNATSSGSTVRIAVLLALAAVTLVTAERRSLSRARRPLATAYVVAGAPR